MSKYINYEGELLTFHLDDNPIPLCRSLVDLDIEVSEKGVLLLSKDHSIEYGYMRSVTGMDFEDFMHYFGYFEKE